MCIVAKWYTRGENPFKFNHAKLPIAHILGKRGFREGKYNQEHGYTPTQSDRVSLTTVKPDSTVVSGTQRQEKLILVSSRSSDELRVRLCFYSRSSAILQSSMYSYFVVSRPWCHGGTPRDLDSCGSSTFSGTQRSTVLRLKYLLVPRPCPNRLGSQGHIQLSWTHHVDRKDQKHRLLADSFFLLLTAPVPPGPPACPAPAGRVRRRARLRTFARILAAIIDRFRQC